MDQTVQLTKPLSESQLYLLFDATLDSLENDDFIKQSAKDFARQFPEFGKGWKWYWTEYLKATYQ